MRAVFQSVHFDDSDESGNWHENPLPFVGRKPQIVFDRAGNAIVVYAKGDNANYHGHDPGETRSTHETPHTSAR